MNVGFPVVRLLIPRIGSFFRVAGVYTQFLPMFSLLENKKRYAEELEYGRIWEYKGEWPTTS
jgi:hypothetical protein